VVAPLAPWVFGSVSVAVVYLPGLVVARLGGYALLFATLVTLLTAAAGIIAVPVARRWSGERSPLAGALGLVTAGLLVAAGAAATVSPALVLVAAVVLGAGYGCCQVCGLNEVARLAAPERLAGTTAAYQALSYLGFVVALPLAALRTWVAPPILLLGLAVGALGTLGATTRSAASAAPIPAAQRPVQTRRNGRSRPVQRSSSRR